jgi:hypothetical protein
MASASAAAAPAVPTLSSIFVDGVIARPPQARWILPMTV